MLADLAGDFGMRKYGKRTLQEIMPQVPSFLHLVLSGR